MAEYTGGQREGSGRGDRSSGGTDRPEREGEREFVYTPPPPIAPVVVSKIDNPASLINKGVSISDIPDTIIPGQVLPTGGTTVAYTGANMREAPPSTYATLSTAAYTGANMKEPIQQGPIDTPLVAYTGAPMLEAPKTTPIVTPVVAYTGANNVTALPGGSVGGGSTSGGSVGGGGSTGSVGGGTATTRDPYRFVEPPITAFPDQSGGIGNPIAGPAGVTSTGGAAKQRAFSRVVQWRL